MLIPIRSFMLAPDELLYHRLCMACKLEIKFYFYFCTFSFSLTITS